LRKRHGYLKEKPRGPCHPSCDWIDRLCRFTSDGDAQRGPMDLLTTNKSLSLKKSAKNQTEKSCEINSICIRFFGNYTSLSTDTPRRLRAHWSRRPPCPSPRDSEISHGRAILRNIPLCRDTHVKPRHRRRLATRHLFMPMPGFRKPCPYHRLKRNADICRVDRRDDTA
jgi:hypothetical protein